MPRGATTSDESGQSPITGCACSGDMNEYTTEYTNDTEIGESAVARATTGEESGRLPTPISREGM